MKRALVVIDMQNDFIDGALGTPEARAIVPLVVESVEEAARDEDTRLIFTKDTHTKEYLATAEGKRLPVEHCIKPSKGWELSPALKKYEDGAVVIEKPTFGATGLAPFVAYCDEIVIVGLCTDICVISNAMLLKAFCPEKRIAVDSRRCAGVTLESHENALSAMKMCHIDIL